MNLVLDFSVNGGLWLLSQYFKNVIPHCCICSQAPIFILNNAQQMERFSGCGAAEGGEKKGEDTVAVIVIQNQASLFACKLRILYSKWAR